MPKVGSGRGSVRAAAKSYTPAFIIHRAHSRTSSVSKVGGNSTTSAKPAASRIAAAENWWSRHLPRKSRRWKRSEEHTSELQSLMRISYAVFCLKKKKNKKNQS